MDKTERYLDALEHPDRYSDEELAGMMADPDNQEIIEMLEKTKSALQNIPTPDVEAEWQRFAGSHGVKGKRTNRLLVLFSRHAAASIIVIFLSVAALTAAVGIGVTMLSSSKPSDESIATPFQKAQQTEHIDISPDESEQTPSMAETVIFDNQPLDSILTEMTSFYSYKLNFSNENVKTLRLYFKWNQALPLNGVIEELNNFEQINIRIDDHNILTVD
ncbi:MAG: DUF4974 domain-containing protein [Muribaculaceae bacterium]|nr:DUF4974 domain-containing protein [Muribaculaceae bacterium]